MNVKLTVVPFYVLGKEKYKVQIIGGRWENVNSRWEHTNFGKGWDTPEEALEFF